MKKQFIVLLMLAVLSGCKCNAQVSPLTDTAVTAKKPEEKISTGRNAEQDMQLTLMRQRFLDRALPAFRFTALGGVQLDTKALKGKLLVLNFWFTGCRPCITEMPHLNKLVEENKEKEVVFAAPAPETEAQIRKFLKKYPFNYTIIPSSLDYISELKVENFPTHIVVDKEGIVRQVFIGYADDIREKLQAEIDKLL